MNVKAILALAAVISIMAPAAHADSDKLEIRQTSEGTMYVPHETTTIEQVGPDTAVVRTQSAVVEKPMKTKTVIKQKKKKRHLLKLPFITVF